MFQILMKGQLLKCTDTISWLCNGLAGMPCVTTYHKKNLLMCVYSHINEFSISLCLLFQSLCQSVSLSQHHRMLYDKMIRDRS